MESKRITINKNQIDAINRAADYVNNLLECCPADEDSQQVKDLNFTISGLYKILNKYYKRKPEQDGK